VGGAKVKPIYRILFLIIILVAVIALVVEPALAQCAMCKQSVEASEASSAASRFNLAVFVLLIPPVAIFAGIFGVAYRYRNTQGRADDQR
jgi:heme/copper-type cytochrome/quinol oxidase subunit 2